MIKFDITFQDLVCRNIFHSVEVEGILDLLLSEIRNMGRSRLKVLLSAATKWIHPVVHQVRQSCLRKKDLHANIDERVE